MAEETLKQRLNKQLGLLKDERTTFDSHWIDLSDYISPRSSRFLVSDANRDNRRNTSIVDPTCTLAERTLASGMMSGITSPARPWFTLSVSDPAMKDYGPVKVWLEDVQRRMNEVFNKSNLYQSLPIVYAQLGTYGTAAMAVLEDDEDIIRTYPFPIGSYYVSNSARLSVDTVYREFRMTTRQLVEQFGLDNVSDTVKGQWATQNTEAWHDAIHAVYPNLNRQTGKIDAKNKRYKSVYFEKGGDDKVLRESGYDEFPILAPRWEVNGEDAYGSNCPGMTALGQVKALQLEQKRKSQLIDKATNPPMVGPSSLKTQRVSQLPGAVTYVDQLTGQDGLKPLYMVNPNTADLLNDIQDTRDIIRSSYFVDLFLMLQNINTRSMPVEAVNELREEKLLMLGPVLERLNDEFLDPFIDRTFAIMQRKGLLPPAPEVLQGTALRIEYISVMAQAQKSIGVNSMERFVGFVGGMAQAKPEALDKIDVDKIIDNYGDSIGVSPSVIVPDEQVQKIRQQRAEQIQQQQQMQMAQAAVAGAKDLSQANLEGPNALSAIAGGMQQ